MLAAATSPAVAAIPGRVVQVIALSLLIAIAGTFPILIAGTLFPAAPLFSIAMVDP